MAEQVVPSATKWNLLQLLTIDGGCVGDGVTIPLAGVVVDGFDVVVVDVPGTPTQT